MLPELMTPTRAVVTMWDMKQILACTWLKIQLPTHLSYLCNQQSAALPLTAPLEYWRCVCPATAISGMPAASAFILAYTAKQSILF